jgi:hypothetical protein
VVFANRYVASVCEARVAAKGFQTKTVRGAPTGALATAALHFVRIKVVHARGGVQPGSIVVHGVPTTRAMAAR